MSNVREPITTVDDLFLRRSEPGIRDELIEAFMPFARRLARRYLRSGQSLDDLTQVACIGLINAVDRFDPARGINFRSYAVPTILGELKRHHRDRGWDVRVPRQLQEHGLKVKNAVPELCQELGRSPTVPEIAGHIGLSEDDVLEAIEARDAYSADSLDAPRPGSEGYAFSETLADRHADLDVAEDRLELTPYLYELPVRERRVIMRRFFSDRTQSEIAGELGISQMHVSRLLRRALQSLRESAGEEARVGAV